MAVRIEVHGKERAKIKYAVEFRCSSCGCEFWVDFGWMQILLESSSQQIIVI